MNVEYLGGTFGVATDYPESGLPEVAVMGRSNVGKSSLINMMFERRQLARVSRTPGRTQALHFFAVRAGTPRPLCLVDLPGYGYAEAPIAVRRDWPKLVYSYLEKRPTLKLGLLLVDIRRDIKDEERSLYDRLRARGIPTLLVCTKADKEAKTRRKQAAEKIGRTLGIAPEDVIALSSLSREGRADLWDAITSRLGGPLPKAEP